LRLAFSGFADINCRRAAIPHTIARHGGAPSLAVTFDGRPVTSQNGLVRRVLLVALGLSALLWASTAGSGPVPPELVVTTSAAGMSADEASQLAGDPHGPRQSDQQWRAQQHTIAAVTESVWKSALVHAELAAAPSARTFDTRRASSSPDPPVRSTPHYLRHTPLLI
jgi:hypothetical protein